jgi:ribosome-associated protein
MNNQDAESLDLAKVAAAAADEKLGTDVIVLDVGNVLSITGFFVVASAGNTRQVRTIADEVEKQVKEKLGRAPGRTEGISEGTSTNTHRKRRETFSRYNPRLR